MNAAALLSRKSSTLGVEEWNFAELAAGDTRAAKRVSAGEADWHQLGDSSFLPCPSKFYLSDLSKAASSPWKRYRLEATSDFMSMDSIIGLDVNVMAEIKRKARSASGVDFQSAQSNTDRRPKYPRSLVYYFFVGAITAVIGLIALAISVIFQMADLKVGASLVLATGMVAVSFCLLKGQDINEALP